MIGSETPKRCQMAAAYARWMALVDARDAEIKAARLAIWESHAHAIEAAREAYMQAANDRAPFPLPCEDAD